MSEQGYGIVVLDRTVQGSGPGATANFAVKEVEGLEGITSAIAEVLEMAQIADTWQMITIVRIEELPKVMQGFEPGWEEPDPDREADIEAQKSSIDKLTAWLNGKDLDPSFNEANLRWCVNELVSFSREVLKHYPDGGST